MYTHSEGRDAAKLSRATMTNLATNDYSSFVRDENRKKVAENQKGNVEHCRPTYGAYICNTLPRGPYLQYKINDQQQSIRHLTSIDNNEQYQLETACNDLGLQSVKPNTSNKCNYQNEIIDSPALRSHTESRHSCQSPQINDVQLYQRAPNNNWQQFKYPNSTNNKVLPNRGYQTLPNKEKTGQIGRFDIKEEFSYGKPEIKTNHVQTKLTFHTNSDFLKQIQQKNFNMLARMTAASLAKNLSTVPSASYPDQKQLNAVGNNCSHIRVLSETVRPLNNSANQLNCVTLSDVMQLKPGGLNEFEGWALLCQSVQALQDLFLADTPPTSKILPLVRAPTTQITSRGRVVFRATTIGQLNKFKDASAYFDVTAHLSPEYLNSMGKKTIFTESDIEKMWIYSLGVTLHETIKGSLSTRTEAASVTTLNSRYDKQQAINPEIMSIKPGLAHTQEYDHSNDTNPSLNQVIACMCEHNLHFRASLMYLLDVISKFCRSQQQVKPFSHIIMELFKEVTSSAKVELGTHCEQTTFGTLEGFKSETDSGRSSAHGDKDFANSCDTENTPHLKVIRNQEKYSTDVAYQKFSTIGYAGIKTLLSKKESNRPPKLQVVRRNKEGILKRRNSFRRNTIDVNLYDLEKARQENFHVEENINLNTSKSTNFIDKLGGSKNNDSCRKTEVLMRCDGISMPDLNSRKLSILTGCKFTARNIKGFDILTKAFSEDSFWIKQSGPEFIVKSSLPSREIELTESKQCQHRRIVSVLLLNGQSLHISCNSVTTTAHQIFEAVIKSENYIENFCIGLCALIGGDFVFLPRDLKIYKVAPQIWVNLSKKSNNIDNVFFTLFLRIKFFLPTLRGISSLESRHMLYLQLRKSVLEKHILCTDDDLISLGGLALQAEIGDFKESMKYSEYFTISHYLPEGVYHRNKEMAKYLRNSHYCRQGLHPKEAEQNFIKYIQEMKEYGFHLYSAIWTTDDGSLIDVYVGISLCGIAMFERKRHPQVNPATNSKISYQRKLYASFEWLEIENLCFSKHVLCIVVRKTESLKAKDNNRIKYKLRMDGRKSYFAFSLASEHHQFYMKLRNSFISLKSLSDKLNIPITSSSAKEKNFGIESNEVIVGEGRSEHDFLDIPEDIKKIDKQLQGSGLGVRNLKKSMLNDNRLLKLKQKFLRRSKSTVGVCGSNSSKKDKDFKMPKNDKPNNVGGGGNSGSSKEENQNKENECPKVHHNDLSPKVCSPNRNRVKMGTRVFSTQFLNKSYDNIYDRTLNLCRFESANSIENDLNSDNVEGYKYSTINKAVRDFEDVISLKSTSISSLNCSEKLSTESPDSPLPSEAYVIHSSIKSENQHPSNFTLPNETISDSLLEKFNNMSGNNSVNDRVLTKLTVVKERLSKNQGDKGNSSPRCDPIKYATFNQKLAKGAYIKDRNQGYVKGPQHLSRSQESIFINNKFQLRNDPVNHTNMANDLNGFTLGISIVQGSDNNVYVKDLVRNGPGEKSGIAIGDQIIAVNGISLLNLSYADSLRLLQNTGLSVELTISQIFKKSIKVNTTNSGNANGLENGVGAVKFPYYNVEGLNMKVISTNHENEYLKRIEMRTDDASRRRDDNCGKRVGSFGCPDDNLRPTWEKFKSPTNVDRNLCLLSPSKSMPDLPKVIAIVPKYSHPLQENMKVSRTASQSRKYLGPMRYPVTPIKTILTTMKHQLSLLADSDDEQVYFLSFICLVASKTVYQTDFPVV